MREIIADARTARFVAEQMREIVLKTVRNADNNRRTRAVINPRDKYVYNSRPATGTAPRIVVHTCGRQKSGYRAVATVTNNIPPTGFRRRRARGNETVYVFILFQWKGVKKKKYIRVKSLGIPGREARVYDCIYISYTPSYLCTYFSYNNRRDTAPGYDETRALYVIWYTNTSIYKHNMIAFLRIVRIITHIIRQSSGRYLRIRVRTIYYYTHNRGYAIPANTVCLLFCSETNCRAGAIVYIHTHTHTYTSPYERHNGF